MGTLEGDERRSGSYYDQKNPNIDSSDDETQEFDSQYSPGGVSECDGTNDNLNIAKTVTFDDTYQLEDASKTQMVNLAAETQVVDLVGETQVVDLYEESQKVDLYEETQKADLYEETQMVDLYEETQMVDLYEESQKADLYEETQMVDLYEESQKANLYEETQMVDLYGETQMVDLPGETQVLKFDAELDDVNEHGQTNKADIVCETQILSEDEDDSAKLDAGGLVRVESTVDKNSPKKESPFRGFTAIRAASIRAAGLAARARSSRDLPTTSSDKSSLEEQSTELECEHKSKSATKSDQEFLRNGYSDISERKLRSTAVRKLFGEDQDAEADESETENNQIDDNNVDMFACENSLAGLSYANSQEPGDLSQARALEVVDRFLDLGFLEDDEGFGKRAQNVEKSKIVSAAKGSRDLAKKSTLQNTVGECDIYDWDDAREDDGGGEFFLKKKELFFENEGRKQKCLTEPRKSNSKKEKQSGKTRLGNLVQSDVGLLNKARSKSKTLGFGEEALQKNLVKNFDEQLDEVSGAELLDNDADKGIPDISNIGPDTQMAAEAMGDLCFEVHMDDCNNSGDKGISIARKDDNVGVTTRQAKRTKRINTRDKSGPSLLPNQQCRITKKSENGVAEKRSLAAANVPINHETEIIDRRSEKCCMEDQLDFSIPVARRTPKSRNLNCSKVDANSANSVNARSEINDQMTGRAYRRRNGARDKNAVTMTIEKIRKVGLSRLKQSSKTCVAPPRQETLAGTQHSERLKMSTEVAAATPIIPNNDHSNHSLPTVNGRNARKGDAKSYDKTPVQGAKSNGAKASSTWATPTTTRTTLGYDVSPICMGDEYQKQSCRKNLSTLSLLREIDSLHTGSPEAYSGMRESRKRKDITTIKVLFSQHLDEDVVNKQKKILTRLGGAVASTMVDATHFVADEFVRTRNMLEAIACGKPVVTSLWIESCGQASCLIDEKNYILRDAKKEKEFGFCLPVSLARACQQPLLKGQKVFITPNTKPGKEILTNLVKAVHGMPIERLGRSAFKDEKIPDDLLILSCEEDYDACIPFLEKGGAIYSSELLLNGIVKQKLEYQRHCLFADQVKRTRSTIWLKKRNKFLPVTK